MLGDVLPMLNRFDDTKDVGRRERSLGLPGGRSCNICAEPDKVQTQALRVLRKAVAMMLRSEDSKIVARVEEESESPETAARSHQTTTQGN